MGAKTTIWTLFSALQSCFIEEFSRKLSRKFELITDEVAFDVSSLASYTLAISSTDGF